MHLLPCILSAVCQISCLLHLSCTGASRWHKSTFHMLLNTIPSTKCSWNVHSWISVDSEILIQGLIITHCSLTFCFHSLSTYRVGQKKTAPYILLYLFTFINNIPCGLKLYRVSYIYWSPNQISMWTVCSKKLQQNQSTRTSLCHNGKTQQQCNAWLCLYHTNSSVQQPDSQVNNCSNFNVPSMNLNYCF